MGDAGLGLPESRAAHPEPQVFPVTHPQLPTPVFDTKLLQSLWLPLQLPGSQTVPSPPGLKLKRGGSGRLLGSWVP